METALSQRAKKLQALLAEAYPEARCELDHRNAYELLVATILSAQCTDARVNQVTPAFFARFPDAHALAQAGQEEVEELIKSTGFYRNKAKALLGMAKALVERHGGEVPRDMEAMVKLPGVGRKTANVVLGTAYGLATGIVVDTHVARVSQRLGLTTAQDPEKIEQDLMALFPKNQWVALSHRLILHGRYVCKARKPACSSCRLAEICPRVGV
ncbi:endonuclease III [Thermoanaerobaculum aquaticum]|uniref:Endonuclease III n=1 Tax=Thermoanaerobaculum aquaticum TaxID=1312852 RepID=A0A062XS27_9BACT|nr:endonuclease III [Thermoanaerobaculum aquaticum]KDA53648.1 endonuclease III [Thermoanaerobaculum aquaticum]